MSTLAEKPLEQQRCMHRGMRACTPSWTTDKALQKSFSQKASSLVDLYDALLLQNVTGNSWLKALTLSLTSASGHDEVHLDLGL